MLLLFRVEVLLVVHGWPALGFKICQWSLLFFLLELGEVLVNGVEEAAAVVFFLYESEVIQGIGDVFLQDSGGWQERLCRRIGPVVWSMIR